jgi:hypothetical protein
MTHASGYAEWVKELQSLQCHAGEECANLCAEDFCATGSAQEISCAQCLRDSFSQPSCNGNSDCIDYLACTNSCS